MFFQVRPICFCCKQAVAYRCRYRQMSLFMRRPPGWSPLQFKPYVCSNYVRCRLLHTVIVRCLCSCAARQVGTHCSSNHCIFNLFPCFSTQFKPLFFQRFAIAFSTTLYYVCSPSRLLHTAIVRCRCSCAVRQVGIVSCLCSCAPRQVSTSSVRMRNRLQWQV